MAFPAIAPLPAGTSHTWLSNPEPLNAALALARRAEAPELQHMYGHSHSQQQRMVSFNVKPPSQDDLKMLLPATQHDAISRGSAFREEADAGTRRFVERLGIRSYDKFRRLGLDTAHFMYSTSASAEVLTAIANMQAVIFFVDDLCFDKDDLPSYHGAGGGPVSRDNRDLLNDFLARSWSGMLRSPDPTKSSESESIYAPVEMAVWEVGRDLRRLSTPDWYEAFVQAAEEVMAANQALRVSPAYASLRDMDLESYTRWRARTVGVPYTLTLLEVANQCFLPPQARNHPVMLKLLWAAGIGPTLVNDIFSYAKEVDNWERDYCPIRVVMRQEGLSLPDALRRVVEVANSYNSAFRLAEEELPLELKTDSAVRRYVQALKEIWSGNLHLHANHADRYSWPLH